GGRRMDRRRGGDARLPPSLLAADPWGAGQCVAQWDCEPAGADIGAASLGPARAVCTAPGKLPALSRGARSCEGPEARAGGSGGGIALQDAAASAPQHAAPPQQTGPTIPAALPVSASAASPARRVAADASSAQEGLTFVERAYNRLVALKTQAQQRLG